MSFAKRPPISTESSVFSEADTLSALKNKNEPVRLRWWKKASETPTEALRRRVITRQLLWSGLGVVVAAILGVIIWIAIIFTASSSSGLRRTFIQPNNGLAEILRTYQPPNSTHPANPTWIKDFSAEVVPIQCHSHNDYWHRIPLYEGLAAGCVSTEADVWVGNTSSGQQDLFVGHTPKVLTQSRTLRSLYLDPLTNILTNQNPTQNPSNNLTFSNSTTTRNYNYTGVFSTQPQKSLILLLDFKTPNHETWEVVNSQLADFRSKGWLTHWTPSTGLNNRPITIVASGKASFLSILANSTYRDIFYDAPITQLLHSETETETPYNINNTYYASSSLHHAVGKLNLGRMSRRQQDRLAEQIERASELGLKSRYWDIPGWPAAWRNRIWRVLVELGVGSLNVDDLRAVRRLDWGGRYP